MAGLDLARVVSVEQPYEWRETAWVLGAGYGPVPQPGQMTTASAPAARVVAYDFGIKRNILRLLATRGCQVSVVPAQTPAARSCGANRRRISFQWSRRSRACDYAIEATREIIAGGVPTFASARHQIMVWPAAAGR